MVKIKYVALIKNKNSFFLTEPNLVKQILLWCKDSFIYYTSFKIAKYLHRKTSGIASWFKQ